MRVVARCAHRTLASAMKTRPNRRAGTRKLLGGVWALLGVVAAVTPYGCLYDETDRCGTSQTYDAELERCVCESGFGLVDRTCVPCREHEVGTLSGCDCAEGFARPSEGAACQKAETLGKACASDTECKDPKYSVCHLEGAAGYCTSACETSEDCDRTLNYACDHFGAVGVCERPPTGEGHACATSADCAGFEADYCEAFREKKCLKQGCKQNPSICHGDWVCCDISVLGASLCIPPDALESGACPGGGTLIPRGE